MVPEKGIGVAMFISSFWGTLIAYIFPILVSSIEIWRTFLIFSIICMLG